MDVAELPAADLKTGFDLTSRPIALPPSDVSFAVPEEDSSASAGSPTVVMPPGDEKSPFGSRSDNIPLVDHSDSTSDSELDVPQSVPPRRVPARQASTCCVYSRVYLEKYC